MGPHDAEKHWPPNRLQRWSLGELLPWSFPTFVRWLLHTENFFRNLNKSTRNQIVSTIIRLVWKQTNGGSVPNQSVHAKYNLISVWFNKISKRFLSFQKLNMTRKNSWKILHLENDPRGAIFFFLRSFFSLVKKQLVVKLSSETKVFFVSKITGITAQNIAIF